MRKQTKWIVLLVTALLLVTMLPSLAMAMVNSEYICDCDGSIHKLSHFRWVNSSGTHVLICGNTKDCYARDRKDRKVKHSPGDERGDCELCASVPQHEHAWASAWSTNGSAHWHECTASGCPITDNSQKGGYGAHNPTGGSCTEAPTCSVCGETCGSITGHNMVTDGGYDATCTEPGLTDGSHCTNCSYIVPQQTIPALNHNEVSSPSVDPTCTEPGRTAGSHCSRCGAVIVESSVIPPLDHTPKDVESRPATCTEDGVLGGKVCAVCNAVLEATQIIPALQHDLDALPGKDATCTESGLTQGIYCKRCNLTITPQMTIDPLGHIEEIIPEVPATCTEDGKAEGAYCSRCGIILKAQQGIPASGHDPEPVSAVEPTCVLDGVIEHYVCIACYQRFADKDCTKPLSESDVTIPAKGHVLIEDKAVKATCTKPGLTKGYHCEVCEAVTTPQKKINALGHEPALIPAVPATCTRTGWSEGWFCTRCEQVLHAQVVTGRLDHAYGPWVPDEDDKHTHTCVNCGAAKTADCLLEPVEVYDAVLMRCPACARFGESVMTDLQLLLPDAVLTIALEDMDRILLYACIDPLTQPNGMVACAPYAFELIDLYGLEESFTTPVGLSLIYQPAEDAPEGELCLVRIDYDEEEGSITTECEYTLEDDVLSFVCDRAGLYLIVIKVPEPAQEAPAAETVG